jgi:hypothetical protein
MDGGVSLCWHMMSVLNKTTKSSHCILPFELLKGQADKGNSLALLRRQSVLSKQSIHMDQILSA